ncbi:MAG TPA: NAD(P)H-binding protein [Bacteroidia bacterium]|jgi:putative NADH-flavin reductase|nr:NAD(P)H-binding protein [Bacteroidia bacterium]
MITKKIALFGTNESLVRRVAEEALKRGHSVTAVVPHNTDIKLKHHKLNVVWCNLANGSEMSKHARYHDVVMCLHEPELTHPKKHVKANKAVIEVAKNNGIHRIVSLGHPISLKVDDSKESYDLWKAVTDAQHETLKLFKNEFWLRWEYLHSPELAPHKKDEKHFVNKEIFLSNPEGTNSAIKLNRVIDALLEEAEKTEFIWEEDEIII